MWRCIELKLQKLSLFKYLWTYSICLCGRGLRIDTVQKSTQLINVDVNEVCLTHRKWAYGIALPLADYFIPHSPSLFIFCTFLLKTTTKVAPPCVIRQACSALFWELILMTPSNTVLQGQYCWTAKDNCDWFKYKHYTIPLYQNKNGFR